MLRVEAYIQNMWLLSIMIASYNPKPTEQEPDHDMSEHKIYISYFVSH